MRLSDVAETSRAISQASARGEKVRIVAEVLSRATPDEVEVAVSYLSGVVRQQKLGLGYRSLANVTAEHSATPELTVREVDETLERIARASGPGSSRERQALLASLLRRATADEAHFLRRLIVGELRQGALEGVMSEAVARAANVPSSSVRRALMLCGDLSKVARAALTEGEAGLSQFRLELFRPLQPMLAQTSTGIADALSGDTALGLEYKLDGARVQVHRVGDDVAIFSRRMNDVTARVPELVEMVRALPVRQVVLDGEAIALRPDETPQPFQVTMRRFGRKLGVDAMRAELPLSAFFFDCLHLDGTDVFHLPQSERFAQLSAAVPDSLRIERIIPNDSQEAEAFLEEALERGHEGVMAKALDAPYEAGRRGASWLKIKPSHTLDLVVLAIEWGSGRRSGWLSNLHLGARDPRTNSFVMLGKTFKGMTDEMLAWQTQKFLSLEVGRNDYTVFVRPEVVVEIAFDGVQASSQYPGGLALRFARVKRYRDDKRANEADTIDMVRAIFAREARESHSQS